MQNMMVILATLIFTMSSAFAAPCPKQAGQTRLTFTGDILVHQPLFRAAIGHPNRFSALWADFIPVILDADLAIGNLEGPAAAGVAAGGRAVADPGLRYDSVVYSGTNMVFNYHPSILDDLKNSGFDVLTLANNHSLDRGALGIDRTLEAVAARNLVAVGTRHRVNQNQASQIVTVNGLRLGLISCTEMNNGNPDRASQVVRCGSSEVVTAIQSLRPQVDGVFVMPHWGNEYQMRPSAQQRAWAQNWLNKGAFAVIGNHPHVLQTVENISRADGTAGLVVYSLGNFIAAQGAAEKRSSALAHLDIALESGQLKLTQYSYTPVVRPRGSITLRAPVVGSVEAQIISRQMGAQRCQF